MKKSKWVLARDFKFGQFPEDSKEYKGYFVYCREKGRHGHHNVVIYMHHNVVSAYLASILYYITGRFVSLRKTKVIKHRSLVIDK